MANPSTFTIRALAAGFTAAPTPDAVDTTDVTTGVPIVVPAGCNQLLVMLKNTNVGAYTQVATVIAGDNPPAFRAGLGNLASGAIAQNGVIFLRLEAARFLQDDGKIYIQFANSSNSAAPTWQVTVFNMAII